MNIKELSLISSASFMALMGCSSSQPPTRHQAKEPVHIKATEIAGPVTGHQPAEALPRAVLYKTNRDLDNHVTIVLTPDHRNVSSFPAPSDVGSFSTPLHMADGWLLDRRGGIGPNTVFLTYTYSEYASLPHAPSVEQLMAAIIPDAHVTMAYRLDLSLNRALSDTTAVNDMISTGMPGATPLVMSATVKP